jgi:hypothetical protein
MKEFKISVRNTTDGKQVTLEVEPQMTIQSILDVVVDYWQFKNRVVLALSEGKENKLLNPSSTLEENKIVEGTELLIMPDSEGGF